MSAGGATLALAAMGQTLVVLTGGFDLSAGAVVSLVNVVLATGMGTDRRLAGRCGAGRRSAIGGLVGRLQRLLRRLRAAAADRRHPVDDVHRPGHHAAGHGQAGRRHRARVLGLPRRRRDPEHPAGADRRPRWSRSLVWLLVKNTRFGVGVYAVGSDEDAARAAGHARPVRSSSGPMSLAGVLLRRRRRLHLGPDRLGRPAGRQPDAAADLRRRRARRHACWAAGAAAPVGSVVGAYILMIVVNILLVLNVSAYYSSVAEGAILILAVLGGSLEPATRRSPTICARLRLKLRARRDGTLPARTPRRAAASSCRRPRRRRGRGAAPSWLERHRETLRYVAAGLCRLRRSCWSRPQLRLRQRADQSGLLQLAARPVLASSPSWRSARVRPS